MLGQLANCLEYKFTQIPVSYLKVKEITNELQLFVWNKDYITNTKDETAELKDNVGEQFYNLEMEKAHFISLIPKPKIIKEIDVFGYIKTKFVYIQKTNK